MAKEFKNKDYFYVILLFVNLLFISPLLTRSDEIDEDLQNFEFDLFYKLTATKPDDNLIVTPLSLATLLILLRMSSTPKVTAEIDKVFGLAGKSNDLITQKFQDLLQKFQNHHLFSMTNKITIVSGQNEVNVLEMDANGTIDDWKHYSVCFNVGELSNPSVPTQLKLATEIHFKNLLLKYSLDNLIKAEFYSSNGETINADMIQMLGKLRYAKIPELRSRVVELPYSDGETSIVMLLPYNKEGIKQLELDLKGFTLADIMSYLKEEVIELTVPRIITTVDMTMHNELKALGMTSMFDQLCDSAITIKVSEVDYRARFVLNDKSSREDPLFGLNITALANYPIFRAEHPFIYIIKSSNNLMYLIGKLLR